MSSLWVGIGLIGLVIGIPAAITGIINAQQGTTVESTLTLSVVTAIFVFLWTVVLFQIDTETLKKRLDPRVCLILIMLGDVISIVIFGVLF